MTTPATTDSTGHREPHPVPEVAYADAPSILSEIGWTARFLAGLKCFTGLDRDFYLRKAALLDRIALMDEPDDPHADITETAVAAAWYLIGTDQADVTGDPRAYVRRQYAYWAANNQ
ncbi:hypothetical protein RB628_19315 [Streptomyces sp. ADMS]|uniref:hypothetical protein n=1 Tax=Streptomyces sp. ADMS TaxID=3071415 RepID=UPI00296F7D6D|nr:hypothetical protein [Streptomyces sp. ADMS]MDW4907441.1 hypothetical protein [Streptomyces sp. ADMS]